MKPVVEQHRHPAVIQRKNTDGERVMRSAKGEAAVRLTADAGRFCTVLGTIDARRNLDKLRTPWVMAGCR